MMARREESLAEIRQDIEGGTALPVSADATDADSVGEAFERVRAESMMVWEVVRSACVSYPPPSE